MKNKRIFKNVAMSTMALSMLLTGTAPMMQQFATPIMAAQFENPTPNGVANLGGGSASITIKANDGQSMIGKKFSVYKLFDAENAEGMESINYTWNNEYKAAIQKVVGAALSKEASTVTEYEAIDYIQSLNNHKVEGAQADQTLEGRYSDFRYFVEDLRDAMVEMNMEGEIVNVTDTDAMGNIKIAGLDYGYYIVDEISATEGTHSASSLCMVNTANPDAEVQIKSDYPSIVKKIDEDDNDTGWNDVADYEIGQTVPYRYTTNVPNMNGYHTYFYAFHDKMDEALTFHKDTVSITIEDSTGSYTLKPTEFNVIEGGADETFRVEISDLKKIVDREFAKGMNSDGENTYGQLITLRYDATLNDKAADDTGRPGFENDVKLEFSNNPDSDGTGETGETPWDTVVNFTYKLNVTKVNDHDKLLKGAKFRLYSDEACTQEVYVKKAQNGYIVINRDSLGGNDHTGGSQPAEAVEMVSNEKGVFTIFGLDQGTYWLKETDAPDGYRPLLDPIELTLTPTFTTDRQNYVKGDGATDKTLQKLDATAHIKEFYDGLFSEGDTTLTTSVQEGSADLVVTNKVGSKLPITGSNMTLIMLGAGVVLMTGAYAYNKKRKAVEENK